MRCGAAMTGSLNGAWCTMEQGYNRCWVYAGRQEIQLYNTIQDYQAKRLTDGEALVYVVVQR